MPLEGHYELAQVSKTQVQTTSQKKKSTPFSRGEGLKGSDKEKKKNIPTEQKGEFYESYRWIPKTLPSATLQVRHHGGGEFKGPKVPDMSARQPSQLSLV